MLELAGDKGNEIPIYTEDGYKLPHHWAAFDKNMPCHGVLVNLHNLRALFSTNDKYDSLFDEELQFTTTKYYVYP